jgi:hypothetical protein
VDIRRGAEDKRVSPYCGFWINKRLVATLDFPFGHTLDPTTGAGLTGEGWRLNVEEDGRILVRFADGDTQDIPVTQGDQLITIGDDLYMSLQQRPSQ